MQIFPFKLFACKRAQYSCGEPLINIVCADNDSNSAEYIVERGKKLFNSRLYSAVVYKSAAFGAISTTAFTGS